MSNSTYIEEEERDYNVVPDKEETKPYSEVLAEFKSAYQQMIDAEKKFRDILNREAV